MLLSTILFGVCWGLSLSHVLASPRPYPLVARYPYGTQNSSGPSDVARSSHHFNNSRTPIQGTTSYKIQSQPGTITPTPVKPTVTSISRADGGICQVGDSLCNSTGITATVDGPKIPGLDKGLPDQCMLWDSSCSGNKTKALNNFFDNTGGYLLFENACFVNPNSTWCAQHDAKVLPEFAKIKSWMRSPQCMASSSEYLRNLGQTAMSAEMGESCCNTCYLSGKNVDLYYWPQRGANTSCLSIIGEKVNPLNYGATTSYDSDLLETTTYWGCTAQTPVSGDSIIRTAQITTVGSLTYKAPLVNPWSPPECVGVSTPYANSNYSVTATSPVSSIRVRPRSLVPSSITHEDGTPVTTVVADGYTFTSPFIYANFFGIGAGDWCGDTTIQQTMISFTPGELSTIAGPLYSGISAGHTRPDLSTKVFNFADLPCPPQSVMEENWYKPEPGDPYRPLIAIPSKVRAINPFFSACTDLWFDAVDPPRALNPQDVMGAGFAPAPVVTSATYYPPLAHKSASAMIPSNIPNGNSPATTLPPSPGASLTAGATNTNVATKAPSPDPTNLSNESSSNKATADPQDGPSADFNPQNASPQEMSKIKQALSTDSESDPPSNTDPEEPIGQDPGSSGIPNKPIANNDAPFPPDPAASAGQGPASKENPVNPSAKNIAPSPTILSVGNHAMEVAPSGVQVDNVPVDPGQTPVSLPGDAAAMINKDQNGVVIGSQIYHISAPPNAPNAGPGSPVPVTTTLPNGAKAIILPTTTAATIGGGSGVAAIHAAEISIYGTTLTPGAPAIIVTTTPTNGSPAPLTLSLDSNGNIIYNPVTHTLPQLTYLPNKTPLPGQAGNIPITTSILNNQPLVVLPHGEGVSIAGTTLTPSPNLTGKDEIMISGTEVSLLGTSALVIGGSSTITLPSDPTDLAMSSATANGAGITGSSAPSGSIGASVDSNATGSQTIVAFSPGKTDSTGRVVGASAKRPGVTFSGFFFGTFVWAAIFNL